jgi:ABC-type glutathione transport system ATPase component
MSCKIAYTICEIPHAGHTGRHAKRTAKLKNRKVHAHMSVIELSGITKRWGEIIAVDNVSFWAGEDSFAILLGPSGCGKSTTLRMIAGLEDVSEGMQKICALGGGA